MTLGYILYEEKNGTTYANFCKSMRVKGIKHPVHQKEYLGKVINRKDNVFKSKKRGTFRFTIDGGFEDLNPDNLREKSHQLQIIFGDLWFLGEVLKSSGYKHVLTSIMPEENDTLLSLLSYKLLQTGSDKAYDWWNTSYARILYPHANLISQSLSEFFERLSSEKLWRKFYKLHYQFVSQFNHEHAVIIESSGFPNKIKLPSTQIKNHNGVVTHKLIHLADRVSGMPIYFQYIPGNIIDVSTLNNIIIEAKAFGIKIKHVLLDAYSYLGKNVRLLNNYDIPYIVRLISKNALYKELFDKFRIGLDTPKYAVWYNGRVIYARIVKTNIFGKNVYAYVMIDNLRKHNETYSFLKKALDKKLSFKKMENVIARKGFFIIISSTLIPREEIIPYVCSCHALEQVFDVEIDCADNISQRVHSECTLRGLLTLSFIASTVYLLTNTLLKPINIESSKAFRIFRNVSCKEFKSKIIISEPKRDVNTLLKGLKLELPSEIIRK